MEKKFIGVFAVRRLELVKMRLSGAAAGCAQRRQSESFCRSPYGSR